MSVASNPVDVDLQLSGQVVPVRSDPSFIEQILLNLALNARDALPDGGKLTISMRLVPTASAELPLPLRNRPGRFAALAVTDTGVGIPAPIQSRVFEPFFTTKEVGAGTGLGLATVYAITERLGGSIVVDSHPGRGSTFTLFLPLSEEAAEPARPEPGISIDIGGHETLLLAEDDDQLRELIARVLRGAGYVILVAEDGEEAVNVFRENVNRINLVIVDVIMPRCGGAEVEEAVRELRPNLPVLFSSGYGDALAETGTASGARRSVILKPYAPRELLRAVRELLDAGGADSVKPSPD